LLRSRFNTFFFGLSGGIEDLGDVLRSRLVFVMFVFGIPGDGGFERRVGVDLRILLGGASLRTAISSTSLLNSNFLFFSLF